MIAIDEVPVGPDARIYAEGWQSWSPTTWYRRGDDAHRPAEGWQHVMRFRPGTELPEEGVQGEGLLVIDPGSGEPARIYGTLDAATAVPSIHATWRNERVVVEASSPVETWTTHAGSASTGAAPGRSDRPRSRRTAIVSARHPVPVWVRRHPACGAPGTDTSRRSARPTCSRTSVRSRNGGCRSTWCRSTTAGASARGEWTAPNPRFGSLPATVGAIRDSGSTRRHLARSVLRRPPVRPRAAAAGLAHWTGWVQLGRRPGRLGPDPSRRPVAPRHRVRGTARPGRGLPQARLPVLGGSARRSARSRRVTHRGLSLRSGTHPRGDGRGRLSPRMRRTDPAERRPRRRDARVSGHLPRGWRRRLAGSARPHVAASQGLAARRLWTTDPDCLVARPEFALREEWAEVVLSHRAFAGSPTGSPSSTPRGMELVRQLLKEPPA